MRSQTSPSPQEGQRLTLHEEGSGSFLRIHRSYSHPTGEVTPLGTIPVPRCPPWCSPSTLRAQRSSCWQLPPRCPPSQGQHPDASSLCCRPPTLPVGLPKTPHAHPQGWTRVGAASHGFIGGWGCSPRHGDREVLGEHPGQGTGLGHLVWTLGCTGTTRGGHRGQSDADGAHRGISGNWVGNRSPAGVPASPSPGRGLPHSVADRRGAAPWAPGLEAEGEGARVGGLLVPGAGLQRPGGTRLGAGGGGGQDIL